MRGMNDKIRAQMNSMINNTTTRSYLQDAVITMRDGRYCLPVKAEAKSQVPGMVHDQSSSGSTLFIEPLAVVNLNNEYKALLIKEKEEIEVILANLSNLTAGYSMQLHTDYNVLTELDFILQKQPSHRLTMVLPRPSTQMDGSISKRPSSTARRKKSSADRRAPRRRFYPAYHYRSKHRW